MGKIPYEIKTWKHWKVADYPDLVKLEQKLTEKGLKNPWLRNEAWKFQSHLKGIRPGFLLFQGIGWGFGAFLIAVGLETMYYKNKESDSAHH